MCVCVRACVRVCSFTGNASLQDVACVRQRFLQFASELNITPSHTQSGPVTLGIAPGKLATGSPGIQIGGTLRVCFPEMDLGKTLFHVFPETDRWQESVFPEADREEYADD